MLARAESSTVEVVVTTGTVQFRTETQILTLTGNQAAEFDTQTNTFASCRAPIRPPGWARLILMTPLGEVFHTLERYYAVRIEGSHQYGRSGFFPTLSKGDPIDSFLEQLSIFRRFHLPKEGDTVDLFCQE